MKPEVHLLNSRTKTFLHFSVLAIVITSLLMSLHLGYLFYGVVNANKVFLKRMCRNVRLELSREHLTLSEPFPKQAKETLDMMLRLVNDCYSLRCVIVRNDGSIAYQNAPLSVELTPEHFGKVLPDVPVCDIHASQEDRRFFFNGVTVMGNEFMELMETWQIMERMTIEGGAIFIETECHFELFERLLESALFAFLLTVLLLWALNIVFRKNIFRPLTSMRQTLQEIRCGHLNARIDCPNSHDALAVFIRQLNDTFADLENAFAGLRRFSSDAAHELRTPLTIIRGSLEVCLAKPRTTEEYQEVLSQVLEESVSLGKMIEILLLMTRMECNACEKSVQDVSAIAEDAAQWGEMLAEEKEQRIETHIQQGIAAAAVPELLKLLFRNLLHNAVKYSPEKGHIVFTLCAVDGTIVIEVMDNGMGIPKEEQKQVFNRFFRGRHDANSGYGLGLALVKQIVDYHGGTVSVSSEVGEGTVFTVTLNQVHDSEEHAEKA